MRSIKLILLLAFLTFCLRADAAIILRNCIINKPAVSSFSPSDLTGLKLWLRADQGVYSDGGTTPANDGDAVQQWNDQSGQGNNATQATSGNRLIYKTAIVNGYPVLRATTLGRSMSIPAAVSSDNPTIFMVLKPVTITNAYHTAYYMYNMSPAILSTLASGPWGTYLGGDVPSGVTLTANTFYILSLTINSVSGTNGITFGTNGSTSTSTGNAYERGTESILNRQGTGQDDTYDFVEVIVYDNALSSADRNKVRDYLNTKYAIY